MRRNPLLSKPPVPTGYGKGHRHRLGSMTEESVTKLFYDSDPMVRNMYEGVHITPHPIVASAYALNRRELDYNDYGYLDIVNPPVLIGLTIKNPEHLDADGYVVAKAIYDFGEQLFEDGVSSEDDLFELEDDYSFGDYTWNNFYFDPYLGLSYAGGTFGNQPEYGSFVRAVQEQLLLKKEHLVSDEDLLENALALASEIVPQSRVLRDIYEDEIAAIVVLPPYVPAEEDSQHEEMPSPPFLDLSGFEQLETPEEFDRALLEDSFVIYGDVSKAKTWHGTSLTTAATALPAILTPELQEKAIEAGAAYTLSDFEELEDEEDT